MCHLLRPLPGETVVDLGAGYGRLGLVLAGHYPEVNFIGFEYVKERVTEGSRILEIYQCQRASLIQQDLTDEKFSLPLADYYLIYDYGTVAHIRQTLKKLEELSSRKKFKVIGRGKGTRSLIQYEHPWLADVFDPIHRENFSIYSMSGN
jgi:precorrin-6B methylase 2